MTLWGNVAKDKILSHQKEIELLDYSLWELWAAVWKSDWFTLLERPQAGTYPTWAQHLSYHH